MNDFDAIIIGSGAGGMAAALCLARAGQKVLVVEQHYLPGGWCHSFSLDGFQFSPGVHYIGGLGEGGELRAVYEGLGVADDLEFLQLNPDGYDHVVAGGERFDIPAGRDNYEARLRDRFPHQVGPIRGYLDAVEAMGREIDGGFKIRGLRDAAGLPAKIPTILKHGLRTLDGLYDKLGVEDPMLKAIFSSIAGDHGVGPARASALMHAGVVAHYLDGGWYPKGGAKMIPRAFIRALKRHGGELRLSAPVDEILVEGEGEGRRAVGVRLASGEVLRAGVVVSNADPGVTWGKLVDERHQSWRLKRKLKKTSWSIGTLSLFLAVDMDLAAAGLDSGNYWYSATHDVNEAYERGRRGRVDGEIPGLFLTATTLKDREKRKDGLHTLEVFSFNAWDAFKAWDQSDLDHRPAEYRALKRGLTERMLQATEKVIPGISEHVVFQSLGTPITNRYYCEATEGSIYGIEKTRGQIGPLAYPIRSEIEGLFQCGASTSAHGVVGATFSGIGAACAVMRCSRREFLTEQGQHLRTRPCDVEHVPEEKSHEELRASSRS